jgi:hypothetical protein
MSLKQQHTQDDNNDDNDPQLPLRGDDLLWFYSVMPIASDALKSPSGCLH